MKKYLLYTSCLYSIGMILFFTNRTYGDNTPISEDTGTCLECHAFLHPGIVEDWKRSKHAQTTVSKGLEKEPLNRRISANEIPKSLSEFAVGCAECHLANPEKHEDTFDHMDYPVHSIVTPGDCKQCHSIEVKEYGENLMSHAYGNLQGNPVYRSLVDSINGIQTFEASKITQNTPDAETNADSCFYCHGTKVEVQGMKTVETDEGEMSFPVLSGWPNQGVGRINPDGTRGSCGVCHTRHQFSIEIARKPHTCAECHKGPDVPAYTVYNVSKHGNIYHSKKEKWDFNAVPWTVGRDFTAPTCAVCHISLIVSEEKDIIAKRTHRMNDRLPWRIFGLIYAHAHPKSPDTAIIRNKAGLPLPTELTGEQIDEYVIGKDEQEKRQNRMEQLCLSCHSTNWVRGHFNRFENSLATTNKATLTSTKIILSAWDQGIADGLAQKDSIFNEGIEKKWVEQWLFYANSTRFASAMAGADYGAFANGRYYMSKNIQDMMELFKMKLYLKNR